MIKRLFIRMRHPQTCFNDSAYGIFVDKNWREIPRITPAIRDRINSGTIELDTRTEDATVEPTPVRAEALTVTTEAVTTDNINTQEVPTRKGKKKDKK